MPIKRLTPTREQIAFPRLGVLRKGGEKRTRTKNNREYEIFGEDLDYFRFDTDDTQALADFTRIFGEHPRTVRVVLPYPTMEQNFSVWQEAYTAGALQHRCDGETCVRWLGLDGKYHDEPIPCPSLDLPENDKTRCKPVGRLQVLIPDLRRLAHVIVLTHAINDILELQKNMLALEQWRGDLRGIVWAISRKPVEISTPNDTGGRVRREKWLLFMEPMADYATSLLQATTQAALGSGVIAALPDGRNANTETGEIFEIEPEPVVVTPAVVEQIPDSANAPTDKKQQLIAQINDWWRYEAELGGDTPIDELGQNLQNLLPPELKALAKTIEARCTTLEAARADTAPVAEVTP